MGKHPILGVWIEHEYLEIFETKEKAEDLKRKWIEQLKDNEDYKANRIMVNRYGNDVVLTQFSDSNTAVNLEDVGEVPRYLILTPIEHEILKEESIYFFDEKVARDFLYKITKPRVGEGDVENPDAHRLLFDYNAGRVKFDVIPGESRTKLKMTVYDNSSVTAAFAVVGGKPTLSVKHRDDI